MKTERRNGRRERKGIASIHPKAPGPRCGRCNLLKCTSVEYSVIAHGGGKTHPIEPPSQSVRQPDMETVGEQGMGIGHGSFLVLGVGTRRDWANGLTSRFGTTFLPTTFIPYFIE